VRKNTPKIKKHSRNNPSKLFSSYAAHERRGRMRLGRRKKRRGQNIGVGNRGRGEPSTEE